MNFVRKLSTNYFVEVCHVQTQTLVWKKRIGNRLRVYHSDSVDFFSFLSLSHSHSLILCLFVSFALSVCVCVCVFIGDCFKRLMCILVEIADCNYNRVQCVLIASLKDKLNVEHELKSTLKLYVSFVNVNMRTVHLSLRPLARHAVSFHFKLLAPPTHSTNIRSG